MILWIIIVGCVRTRMCIDPMCDLASKKIPDEQVPWLASGQHGAAVPTKTPTFAQNMEKILVNTSACV